MCTGSKQPLVNLAINRIRNERFGAVPYGNPREISCEIRVFMTINRANEILSTWMLLLTVHSCKAARTGPAGQAKTGPLFSTLG